ncbi:MAG: esterase [Chitinophagaceae bacterium]|nr:MAG: esterase [Chitinophagaceae bacterium]
MVEIINAGINGNNTADLLIRLEKDVLQQSPELVVMMVGTNDMLNEKNMLTLKVYEKNYLELINRIREKTDLMLMTIPPVYSPYIIARKPALNFKEGEPGRRVNAANKIIRRLAANSRCLLIDLHKVLAACGGSDTNKDCLFQNEANSNLEDGVHPTYDGYRVIAAVIYEAIKISFSDVKKIICFGDSLTYGYAVEGGGTIAGKSYPALLNKMLN